MTAPTSWRKLFQDNSTLPVILVAAVVQGWVLYWLHVSIENDRWPATRLGVLAALYALAVFVPLTVQRLAQDVNRAVTWCVIGVIAILYALVAWHCGRWVTGDLDLRSAGVDEWFALAFTLGVLWLLVMPFVQARLADGRWRPQYERLFSTAWNNKFVLAEAVAFVGLFWLLLFLWAQLFRMIGIAFFKELFAEPVFVYPVTALAFGIALHLIGSLERLTHVLLEQVLNVLKWLAIVAGLILAFFTAALLTKLPGMIASGERAIAAAWLLWLVAVTVLLVNAAYRDGSNDAPYPRGLGIALRCVIPLTIVISLTALYALWLRIDEYGFTASRVWACVVAGAAVIYSIGYGLACWRGERWMQGIATVNIAAALYLIVTIALALTPVLSPQRIAANSQFARALANAGSPPKQCCEPMHYLRFDAGEYGVRRLQELSRIEDHPHADALRRQATALLARKERYVRAPVDADALLASMIREPNGPAIEPGLMDLLRQEMREGSANAWRFSVGTAAIAGMFIDLNDDGHQEFVLVRGGQAVVFTRESDRWSLVGPMIARHAENAAPDERIAAGDFSAAPAPWRDLVVGGRRYRIPTED